jgi:hypothetical protein
MIITNNLNLPRAFVEMAKQDYEVAPNEYRVTSLLGGLRETILMRRHSHEITVDVADMVWMLFGTAVHNVLEHQQEAESELKEERLKVPVGDYILSGKFDLYCYEKRRITDYKTTSVWKIIYENFKDWRTQSLIYAFMMERYGFPVDNAEIIAYLKDHNKRDARNKAGYPPLPVHSVKFRFDDDDFENIAEWINGRFEEIAILEKLPDNQLPVCTPEERFNDGDTYAVMAKGKKRALRVLGSMEEAEAWLKNNKGDFVDIRQSEDKKCNDYCFACEFCDYHLSKREEIAV